MNESLWLFKGIVIFCHKYNLQLLTFIDIANNNVKVIFAIYIIDFLYNLSTNFNEPNFYLPTYLSNKTSIQKWYLKILIGISFGNVK